MSGQEACALPDAPHTRQGHLVLVVGPSGAGKDTLINGARATLTDQHTLRVVRRVVTRISSQWEDHDSLDVGTFLAQQQAGAFALHWQAHGLHYGIPAIISQWLGAGDSVICNCSRAAIKQARERFPDVVVVLVTASKDILAARLAGRARETTLSTRLERGIKLEEDFVPDYTIFNDGAPATAIAEFVRILEALH